MNGINRNQSGMAMPTVLCSTTAVSRSHYVGALTTQGERPAIRPAAGELTRTAAWPTTPPAKAVGERTRVWGWPGSLRVFLPDLPASYLPLLHWGREEVICSRAQLVPRDTDIPRSCSGRRGRLSHRAGEPMVLPSNGWCNSLFACSF